MKYTPTPLDIDEIKGILTWDDDKHDKYIGTMLRLLYDDVVVQTNNNFGGVFPDGTISLPGGVMIYMAKTIELNLLSAGLKSRSMGSVSYTYDLEVPESTKRLLRPYKRLKFHATR
jgi:hypothetical protein